jgi:hypothetical protein
MDCAKIDRNELAEKYLHRQLDEASQDEFEIHILECGQCLQAVELLQDIRFDLNERAPAIRTYTSVPPGWFRWQWIAAACSFLIIGSLGLLQFSRLRRAPQPAVATHTQTSADRNSAGSPPQVAVNSQPINGRNYTDFTLNDSQVTRDNAPTRPSAQQLKGKRALSNPAVSGTAGDLSHGELAANSGEKGTPETSPGQNWTAATSSSEGGPPTAIGAGNPAPSAATNPVAPSSQVGSEVSQLAAVRALPYTFSGVSSSQPSSGGSVRLKHEPASGISGNPATSPRPGTTGFETAQDLFQDAMTEYVDGRYDSATTLLGQAVELDPQFAEGNLYLGICDLLQGNAGGAVVPLQSAVRGKKPGVAQAAHFYLAKAYLQQYKLAEAETELRAAAAIPGRLAAEANAMIPRLQAVRRASEIKK